MNHFKTKDSTLTLFGGGGLEGPPLMNILSHFSCVKAMDLKFLDFLSFSITQLLEKKYFEYIDPGGHRSSSKSR